MSEDERPGADQGQDELTRLLGSDEHYGALIRLATLLLDGDTAAAETSRTRSSPGQALSRRGDPHKALTYLSQAIVNRSRSVRQYQTAGENIAESCADALEADTPPPATWTGNAGSARPSGPPA